MKKILLNFFGQLRFWDLQNTIQPFKEYLEQNGFEVDIFGTFWDDTYTNKFLRKDSLNIFDKLNLIEEPTLKPQTLQKYFYSLKESVKLINYEYDFIITSRPDIFLEITKQSHTIHDFTQNIEDNHIYVQKSHYEKRDTDYWIDDKVFISNLNTLNIISKTFNYFIDGKLDFELLYHRGLLNVLNFFNITVKNDVQFFKINMIRHYLYSKYPFEGGYLYKGELVRNIEKKFQDTSEWIKYVEKIHKIQNDLTD